MCLLLTAFIICLQAIFIQRSGAFEFGFKLKFLPQILQINLQILDVLIALISVFSQGFADDFFQTMRNMVDDNDSRGNGPFHSSTFQESALTKNLLQS